jgi:SWI/SNF-related matrix-associated actin-dependent regulator of chromatin subfamily A3
MDDLLKASQAVEFRPNVDGIKSLAMDEEQLSKLPMAPQPAALRSTLLPYQRQGLRWLAAKEAPKFPENTDIIQLWKRNTRGHYSNIATNFCTPNPPDLVSGGILADDMGLGKTLQVISLILTQQEKGTTLIVAPVSVMSNWKQQISRHIKEDHALSVLTYHGTTDARPDFSKYDVVITSYGKLAREAEQKGILTSTTWRRIVLDEGHTIRNPKTKIAQAACNLNAKSRWVLTGTPMWVLPSSPADRADLYRINTVKDLHSLLKFLRITGGLQDSVIFNTVIARPMDWGDAVAERVLQAIMQDLCLRRKKDMKFVDLKLPAKTEYLHKITFHPEERTKYDALL